MKVEKVLPNSWQMEHRKKTKSVLHPNSFLLHLKDTVPITNARTFNKGKQNPNHLVKVIWPVERVND